MTELCQAIETGHNAENPIIVGSGIAGLVTALALAPRPVTLLSLGDLGTMTSTALAQGGIAVAWAKDDSATAHAQDTINAGAGLCEEDIVRIVTSNGADAVAALMRWGVQFDTTVDGTLDLALEGAHSCRRIAHIGGDGAGAGIIAALITKIKATPSITVHENIKVTRLLRDVDGITGLVARIDGDHGKDRIFPTRDVVLATGGASSLWAETTAPLESWGSGLYLAAKAGAVLRDLCFMQFHPTGLDVGRDPMPLVSEAVRGEGAVLRNAEGKRFLESDLAARDIVARGIWREIKKGSRVFLDVQAVNRFETHFESITRFCKEAGIDPLTEFLPIKPVAHYHMGGIEVDAWGRTNIAGLWAAGEVASTGLHGANRLASNSLLEAAVFALRIADRLREKEPQSANPLPIRAQDAKDAYSFITPSKHDRDAVRHIMSRDVGLWRDGFGLEAACEELKPLATQSAMGQVASLIAHDALARRETRGAHMRLDCPYADHIAHHATTTLPSV